MAAPLPTSADLAGVWQRCVNYEPRDVVADDAAADKSIVLWAQAPCGRYIDVRHVASEGYVTRGFAGTVAVTADTTAPTKGTDNEVASTTKTGSTIAKTFVSTWTRAVDTKPESCPSGVDSSACRFVALPLMGVGDVLLEEGDGFLEVWRRVAVWSSGDTVTSGVQDALDLPAKITIGGMAFTAARGEVPVLSATLPPAVVEPLGFNGPMAIQTPTGTNTA